MARIDLALVEWSETPDAGPRLLGRLADPDLIAEARERIAAARRRDLAALEAPVRLVPAETGDE